MSRIAKMMKSLMIGTVALLALQSAVAQTDKGKAVAGARARTEASESKPPATQMSEEAKVLRAAADALGMPRWSQVGGGNLPEVDVINTVEFWASGTPYSDYHVSLAYNPPGMRVEMGAQHPISVVSGKYAWNESEVGGGLVPGKGTATPESEAVAKERLLQLWTLPFGVVKAGIAAGSKAKVSTEGGASVITFPLMGELAGVTVKATLDAKNFVTKVETQGPGNLTTESDYSDYKDRGEIPTDVQFPGHIVRKVAGKAVLDLQVKMADCNDPYLIFPVPGNVDKSGL